MSLTRRLRSLLADPRRESASILTVMFLVLTVVGVHVLCSVHLDERLDGLDGQGASHSHGAAVHAAGHDSEHGGGSHGCADHHRVAAQCDPLRPAAPAPAVTPELAVQWLVPAPASHEPLTRSSVTLPTAPSLTALGISRT